LKPKAIEEGDENAVLEASEKGCARVAEVAPKAVEARVVCASVRLSRPSVRPSHPIRFMSVR
jgi:hypothetical protein